MIIYRSRCLSRGEVWFDEEPTDTRDVDWILYHRRSAAVPGAKSKFTHTYIVDLTRSEDQLLANLSKDTAYKIRRARERDKIVCESCDSRDPAVIDTFETMYNRFAAMKGLAPLVRARTESMAAAGTLDLSVAKDPQGDILVYHADYRDRARATSLELPSLYRQGSNSGWRNMVGRANRLLTWTCLLRYKRAGLQFFDFGGWYQGTDPGMVKINDFKRGFGGQMVRDYECERIVTAKGWVILQIAGMFGRFRQSSSRPRKSDQVTQPTFGTGQLPVPTE